MEPFSKINETLKQSLSSTSNSPNMPTSVLGPSASPLVSSSSQSALSAASMLISSMENSWLTSVRSVESLKHSWELSGRVVWTYKGHMDAVKCLSVMPNESGFISGSKDGTVKFWNPQEPLEKVSTKCFWLFLLLMLSK